MVVSKALVQLPTKPHALYRFYDRTDALLYVGITMDLPARVSQHRKGKPWWAAVHHIAVEHFDTRDEALEAEATAISAEGPLYNVTHNTMAAASDAESMRTAGGAKRAYADHLLHVLAGEPERYERWRAEASRDIASGSPDEDLAGADDIVYAAEMAAAEVSSEIGHLRHGLRALLDQLPQDLVERCRDQAIEEAEEWQISPGEAELTGQTAWFLGVEFAWRYLNDLPEDERREWLAAARTFLRAEKPRWSAIAYHAAAYARSRKADRWYPPADSMCRERGRHSRACPTRAEVKVWFQDCRICQDEDCAGHIEWCAGHLKQAKEKPFTWRADDQPVVVLCHERMPDDWDDPWAPAPRPQNDESPEEG